MIRARALAGLVFLLAAARDVSAQAPSSGSGPRRVDLSNDFVSLSPIARQAVPAFDVAQLARASPGTWKDFDAASIARDRQLSGYYGTAERAIRAGDWFGALGCLLRVLQTRPDHPPALHMAGMVYFRLQRYGDAALLMARYVEVAPARVGDTRVLGHALYSLGRYDEARAHYERVLAVAPDDVEARHGHALARWRLGDETGALAELDAVLARAPEHAEALAWKAQVLFERGANGDARTAVRRALELDPSLSRAWFLLARIATEAGDESEASTARAAFDRTNLARQAVVVAERRYAASPYDPAVFVELLRARIQLGDRSALRQSVAQAQAVPVEDARVWRLALEIAVMVERTRDAEIAARKLADVAGDSIEDWTTLLAYYRAAGDAWGTSRATARLATLQGR